MPGQLCDREPHREINHTWKPSNYLNQGINECSGSKEISFSSPGKTTRNRSIRDVPVHSSCHCLPGRWITPQLPRIDHLCQRLVWKNSVRKRGLSWHFLDMSGQSSAALEVHWSWEKAKSNRQLTRKGEKWASQWAHILHCTKDNWYPNRDQVAGY